MISSPGSEIASTACMNAMFAPAVTMIALPLETSMPFSAASLAAIRLTSAGCPVPPAYSCAEGSETAARAASTASGGGA